MSGEGLLAACPHAWALALGDPAPAGDERDDVMAYLERRRDNAATIAERWPGFEYEARIQRRQLDIIIGDVRAGMHEGAAGVRARLQKGAETEGETP